MDGEDLYCAVGLAGNMSACHRDILFVEHNGSQFIPLVGIMHGRFHVKRDQAGHESVVTNEGKPVKELAEFKAAVRQKMLAR